MEQEEIWRKRLVHMAQNEEAVRRFQALPGIGWVRAATLYAYLDTPWRFRSKSALWKYLGIGLGKETSLGCQQNDGAALIDRLDGGKDRLWFHDHARAAAIGVIIDDMVFIGGGIADIMQRQGK